LIDIIGYIALIINLFSMGMSNFTRLRVLAALANFIYVIYGVMIGAYPIVIGCAIAVILHVYRLIKKPGNIEFNN
jgi:hypothetical protein